MHADAENTGDRGPRDPRWGERVRPPTKRPNRSISVHLNGRAIHFSVGLEAGRIVELFVTIDKEGSALRGIYDTIARLASSNLQRGASIADVVKQLRDVHADPSGFVDGHPVIRSCTSIVDLVGQMLEYEADILKDR